MEPEITLLEACSTLSLGDDNAVPEWVMLLPAGVSKGVDGRGPYNNDQPDVVVANFKSDGRPLPFDYNHQTIFAALNGSPSPAAGWINDVQNRQGAIWGQVEWTDKGRNAVASKEYRFVSPAFKHDPKTGRVSTMASAALVNSPNLRELPAINAQLSALFPKTGDPEVMDEAQRAAFAAAFGLPATSTAEQLVAHAQTHKLETGTPDPAKFVPMSAFAEVQAKLGELTEKDSKRSALDLVDGIGKGKVTPAMRDWALGYAAKDPDGFTAWATASTVIVTSGVDPNLPKLEDEALAANAALTSTELAACAEMGISPEAYKATKLGDAA